MGAARAVIFCMIYPVLADNYREYLSVWPLLPAYDVYEPSPCDASQ